MLHFDDVIRTLKDSEITLTKSLVRRLSNLEDKEREALLTAWGEIPLGRRQKLMRHIADISESDFDTDFGVINRLAMTDLNENVRYAAIEASAQDESALTFHALLPIASVDLSVRVRAAALSALGRFILAGELGTFSKMLSRQAENLALRLYKNKSVDTEVRRRALEAVANSSREEVDALIRDAYDSGDLPLQTSAVYAMGRSCDEKWARVVVRELGNSDSAMRYEAIRAAGELELEEAVSQIAPNLQGGDRQLMEMSIWALGEIGGGEARRLLDEMIEYAEDIDDDALMEMIEDALANVSLGSGLVF